MRRLDLQGLAQAKIDDAGLLAQNGRWGNAYYLAGYSVELGLKACVARQIAADTIPDRAVLNGVLTHEFDRLVGLAGLKADLQAEQKANVDFATYWGLVSQWSPDTRYKANVAMEAQYLIQAIADPTSGVLQWIRRYW
jgi:hypothetical protein